MNIKDKYIEFLKEYRRKYALEGKDENIALTVHLRNKYQLDINTALDQTSSGGGGDEGIDGWYFDSKENELMIYQSKFSDGKRIIFDGFKGLIKAKIWLEKIFTDGKVMKIPRNKCLYTLYMWLTQNKNLVKKINFTLVSLLNENEIEDSPDLEMFINLLRKSRLFEILIIDKTIETYDPKTSIGPELKKYEIEIDFASKKELRKNTSLQIGYIPLHKLIDLYRIRGYVLFDKNIRFQLHDKDAKERLVNPMVETLNKICNGELNENIFPFYHVGITLASQRIEEKTENLLLLDKPTIINGCQTITIADEFLRNLEEQKIIEKNKIEKFNKISVIAKIVVGTSDEELKQITNSNNRQVQVENWQLFSNDPIHLEIEFNLKDMGIFYERQKGKFDIMKSVDIAKSYFSTNGTFIDVVTLGQIICLCQRNFQWAAKPSFIFINKKNHDLIFSKSMANYTYDMVLSFNLFKAVRRALQNYLYLPVHYNNDSTQQIFRKPLVRAYMYFIALIDYYQNCNNKKELYKFGNSLNKIAHRDLVSNMETCYLKIVKKTINWYLEKSKGLSIKNLSENKLKEHLEELCLQLGIDLENGKIPFTDNSLDWDDIKEKNER